LVVIGKPFILEYFCFGIHLLLESSLDPCSCK
jgi:hypothetical protein